MTLNLLTDKKQGFQNCHWARVAVFGGKLTLLNPGSILSERTTTAGVLLALTHCKPFIIISAEVAIKPTSRTENWSSMLHIFPKRRMGTMDWSIETNQGRRTGRGLAWSEEIASRQRSSPFSLALLRLLLSSSGFFVSPRDIESARVTQCLGINTLIWWCGNMLLAWSRGLLI